MGNSGLDFKPLEAFYQSVGWVPYAFQKEVYAEVVSQKNGLLNAPTGSGKTLALSLPFILNNDRQRGQKSLRMIWVTPVRALSSEICLALERAIKQAGKNLKVAVRTGDTTAAQRKKIKENPPDILITTPETIHILLSQMGREEYFSNLEYLVVDEWHDLLSTKRGVQMELALAAFRFFKPQIQVWGISATIGNLEEALSTLVGADPKPFAIVSANLEKNIQIQTIYPDSLEMMSWSGHLGVQLAPATLPIIENARCTLLFTNTRSQAENWFQTLLQLQPDWAGQMALHHGSLDRKIRSWVEKSIHDGRLKLVVCTSSLDLGVDFKPVDTVIQVGSPKNVSRFVQRAGRSGHAPGEISKIYFVPANTWELAESVIFQKAIFQNCFESRPPLKLAFDVLIQFLLTLSAGGGFNPKTWLPIIRNIYSYRDLSDQNWQEILNFIRFGGNALDAYPDFKKAEPDECGNWRFTHRKMEREHRFQIGTIATDFSMKVKLMRGKYLGTIEEDFIRRLKPGTRFTFSGKGLELIDIRYQEALVKVLQKPEGIIPSWSGGRMPLSGEVSFLLRETLDEFIREGPLTEEMHFVEPMLRYQQEVSHLPSMQEILIETYQSREGHHLFTYPMEGRLVHEGLAMLMAYRISKNHPASFSLAMNDYGFELLSDLPIGIPKPEILFSTSGVGHELKSCNNYSELSKKKFRDIATISGLVPKASWEGRRGQTNLQRSAGLFFSAFQEYDPRHILLLQALDETMSQQLEEHRLRQALQRMSISTPVIRHLETPSPLCFPIMVDRFREKHSNEKVEDWVDRILEKYPDSSTHSKSENKKRRGYPKERPLKKYK